MPSLPQLLAEVRACTLCERHLPLGSRPIVQLGKKARIVIVGQAPGTRVHESGIPWDDASGDHLRQWLAIEREVFYDPSRVALMPMGFCYPGKKGQGDAPPRPECAPQWHAALLRHLRAPLMILAGQHAHAYYLGNEKQTTLTKTVQAYRNYLPECFPLPHPSWRSKIPRLVACLAASRRERCCLPQIHYVGFHDA